MDVKEFRKLQRCLDTDRSGRLVSNAGGLSFDELKEKNNAEAGGEKRQHTPNEENMHMRIVKLMAMEFPEFAPMLVHNANEFHGTQSQGAKRKALGVRKGFPDFSFFVPSDYYHGLHIELKYGKNKQSEEQKSYERLLTSYGYQYVVCRSEEEFLSGMSHYLHLGRWNAIE